MQTIDKIYRFIFPLLLAAIFSVSLYIFQIVPPGYGEVIYNYSILMLIFLFLLTVSFMVVSQFKAGKLLVAIRPSRTNKVFLILGVIFFIFGAGFGGFELYTGGFLHGSYPAGPVMILAGVGSLLGWRITTAVYSNGIRPSCRNFIPWDQIKSFHWLDKVYLHTTRRLPPGGVISFEIERDEAREFFVLLLQNLPLQRKERKIAPPKSDLNSCGLLGYYLGGMEKGTFLEIRRNDGVEVLLEGENDEKHNEQWEKVNFDNLRKLLLDLTSNSKSGNGSREHEIKFRRREIGEDNKEGFCLIKLELILNEDKLKLFLEEVQD